jgi:tRNA A-37 threonylcarbamoyl transferase component Bud32
MATAQVCLQCGKPLPSDAPQGQCPQCLLRAALPGQSTLNSAPPTARAGQAGERLKYFGDYELLAELAHGGMGVVWKARQTSLNREVAVKMIRAGALASPEEVQRFIREAEAAANLQHPNIVAIHEVGEHDGQHYFSMDYVAGRDLEALVKDGPLPPRRAARYVKLIAEAIHFAHQRGTLHRDLKPQNVLIDAADQPRITDFGLAKIMQDDSRLTDTGVVMGSPSYMPPEQAAGRGGDIGPASDVYSLGAMLYELLTGRPPFRGSTALATLQQVLDVEPSAPRKLKADIPVDLETITLKCLEKAPTARYPTARALAEDLERFLSGEPVLGRPASRLRKAVSWGRRHPGVLAAAAALAMVVLAFGTYYLYEENAYLRYQQANPDVVRVKPGDVLEPGKSANVERPRSDSLNMWEVINGLALVPGIAFVVFLSLRARRLSWKDFHDRIKRQEVSLPPPQPFGERFRTMALGVGLLMVFCSGMLLVKAIQANVWEGASIWGSVLPSYGTAWFGLMILSEVVRDYRLTYYGPPSAETEAQGLSAEQAAAIRAAVETGDWDAAKELYRQALPEARRGADIVYLFALVGSLRAENPGKYAWPPLALANLHWRGMLICAVVEVVILGAAWILWPPVHPVAALLQIASSFLLGVAIAAVGRVQGRWKKLLWLVPGVLAITGSEAVVRTIADSSSARGPYIIGIFCGAMLMGCGLSGEAGRALQKKLRAAASRACY